MKQSHYAITTSISLHVHEGSAIVPQSSHWTVRKIRSLRRHTGAFVLSQ